MRKNTQKIAFLILIPMLVFTFVTTIHFQSPSNIDDSKQIIYDYFTYRNNKDLESIKNMLLNPDDISNIESDSKYLEEISLLSVSEENNKSITDAYLKNNDSIYLDNIRIYKIKYRIYYSKDSKLYNKNGTYESWCFLTRQHKYSSWLIDIGAI